MYQPIEQHEPGDTCPNCWGPAKPFGDIQTPKRILLTASGFAGACAVCNGTFILEQNPFLPCIFDMDDGSVFAEIIFGDVNTQFTMEISGGANCYLQLEGVCTKVSTFNGVTITIDEAGPATPEWRIAFDDNLTANRKTVHENLGAINGEKVLRLANKLDRINIYVKYVPEY